MFSGSLDQRAVEGQRGELGAGTLLIQELEETCLRSRVAGACRRSLLGLGGRGAESQKR
jgi:hypothetical protein